MEELRSSSVDMYTQVWYDGTVGVDGLYFLEPGSISIALTGWWVSEPIPAQWYRQYTVLALDSFEQLKIKEEMEIDERFGKLLVTEPKPIV